MVKNKPIGWVSKSKMEPVYVDEYGNTMYATRISQSGREEVYITTKKRGLEIQREVNRVNRIKSMSERLRQADIFFDNYREFGENIRISQFRTNLIKVFHF